MGHGKKFNGAVLKKLREDRGLSQEDFMMDLRNIDFKKSTNTLQKWENDKTVPDVNDLCVIAAFFGVPIQSFFK